MLQSVYGISENIENEITEDTKNIQPISLRKKQYKAEQEMLKNLKILKL